MCFSIIIIIIITSIFKAAYKEQSALQTNKHNKENTEKINKKAKHLWKQVCFELPLDLASHNAIGRSFQRRNAKILKSA